MSLLLSIFITCVLYLILDFTGMIDRIEKSLLKFFGFCSERSKNENTKVPKDKEGR